MMKWLKRWRNRLLTIMKRLKRCKWLTNDYFLWLHARTMMFWCSWWLRWWTVTRKTSKLLMNEWKLLMSMKWLTSSFQIRQQSIHHKFHACKWWWKWKDFDFMERSTNQTIVTEPMEKHNDPCFDDKLPRNNNGLNACCKRNNKKSIWINTVFNECNRRRHLLFHGVCNSTRWHNDWCAN